MSRNTARTAPTAPNGRGRRNQTRKRILDAAAQLLSTQGYSGMRLNEVAELAEIQAPAIYYYFPSREDLVEEVMWTGIADMREHVLQALAATTTLSPMARMMIGIDAHLRHELDISDYTTASIRNAGQLPPSIRKRQLAEEARYGEVWRALFAEAAAVGEIRPNLDLYVAQMLVFGALNWTAEWWHPRRGPLEDIVAAAQSFVREALVPH